MNKLFRHGLFLSGLLLAAAATIAFIISMAWKQDVLSAIFVLGMFFIVCIVGSVCSR